jgi:hypothetical protein
MVLPTTTELDDPLFRPCFRKGRNSNGISGEGSRYFELSLYEHIVENKKRSVGRRDTHSLLSHEEILTLLSHATEATVDTIHRNIAMFQANERNPTRLGLQFRGRRILIQNKGPVATVLSVGFNMNIPEAQPFRANLVMLPQRSFDLGIFSC